MRVRVPPPAPLGERTRMSCVTTRTEPRAKPASPLSGHRKRCPWGMRVRVPPPAPSGDQVSESGWSWARAVYPARESLFGGRHHRYLLSARLLGAASRRERAHLPARRGRGGRRLSGLPSLPPVPVAAVNELHRPGVGLPGSASDPRWRARGGLRHSVSLDQLISSITEFGGLGSGTAHYVALRLGEPPTRPRRPANLSSA